MYVWSLILFTFSHTVTMRQLPSAEGSICIQVPSLESKAGIIQCMIYNDQQEAVRMIPLSGGHKNGVYTLQLRTLPAGKYTVTVMEQQMKIDIE